MLKKSKNFTIVGKANNGSELYKNLRLSTPDILIMEIDLPDVNGINALRSIKSEFPEMRVLIFSTHPEEIYALRSIKSGAADKLSNAGQTCVSRWTWILKKPSAASTGRSGFRRLASVRNAMAAGPATGRSKPAQPAGVSVRSGCSRGFFPCSKPVPPARVQASRSAIPAWNVMARAGFGKRGRCQ